MTSDEKKTVVDRLEAYKKQFDDLLALLDNLPLQRRDKTKAQQMLKNLKASLKNDYRIGDTVRGQEQMTPAESDLFQSK